MERRVNKAAALLLGAGLLTGGLPACDDEPATTADAGGGAGGAGGEGGQGGGGVSRQGVLAAMGPHVFLPTYRRFVDAAGELGEATRALAGAPDDAARLEAARLAWREAMAVWQEAEVLQAGPAGSSAKFTGGQDLRDQIYSWPTVNTCRVDQEVVAEQYGRADFFEAALPNVVGLDTIEYLLFYDAPNNTCPPQVRINSQGEWARLSAGDLARRRAAYAAAAAAEVLADARRLVDAWDPASGDYAGKLARATGYANAQAALNELFWSMFYLDLMSKDQKLATPAGISPACPGDVCPDAVESRWADHGKVNLVGNLRGFRRLFLGNEPGEAEQSGFDDLVSAMGAADLSADILAATDAAIAAVEAIEGDLRAAVQSNPEQVRAAQAALKDLTDLLKSQLVTVLNLSVPQEGAGDND